MVGEMRAADDTIRRARLPGDGPRSKETAWAVGAARLRRYFVARGFHPLDLAVGYEVVVEGHRYYRNP